MIVSPQAPSSVTNTAALREELLANEGLYLREPETALSNAIDLFARCKKSGEKSLIAQCLMELGRCYRQRSELAEAGNSFKEALRLYTSLGDKWNTPKAIHALGTIHSASGKLEDALRCFSGALPLVQANKDWFAAQRILNSWGIVAIRLGDYTAALQCFSECLELIASTPDPYLESSVLANTGAIFERTEAYDKAMQHFERSLVLARELKDERQIGNTLIFMANSSMRLDRLDDARRYAAEALAIAKRDRFTDIASQALTSLSEMALKTGQTQHAIPLLTEARMLLEGTPNSIHYQKVMHAIGAAHLQLGNLEESRAALTSALEVSTTIGSPELLYHTYQALADLASKAHDYELANEYLMQAMKQHELLHNEQNQRAVSMLEFQMAIETYRKTKNEQPKIQG